MSLHRLLFLSSAEISIPLLERLNDDARFEVLGVICQPDKPAGRSMKMKSPPVKDIAEKLGLPVYQPEKLSEARELLAQFSGGSAAAGAAGTVDAAADGSARPDFLLTFAYGQILNADWLALPKIAPVNVHTSLLPKYRGASPIQAALLNGDAETGVSVMKMVLEMDAGPVSAARKIDISSGMTAGILHDSLGLLAAEFVPEELVRIAELGEDAFLAQEESAATYCKKISRADGMVDFKKSALEILRAFRAYTPWPGLFTQYGGKRLKLVDIALDDADSGRALAPGEVECDGREVFVGTSDGCIKIKQLQLEGKQCLHADQFVIGQKEFCSCSLPS